ncbi:uncharacterized protein LOC123563518 [Mercenaria mercenaria]|uniref:uncharacterized protein LOC123563518 n=1 Tax=Mercenaria mercenaria TaxID=6596 RepID=UPI00234E74D9|nr:uncharacterized protein LOC123563518 [Mercenaria mercenaria]
MHYSRVWIFAILLTVFTTELDAKKGGGHRRDNDKRGRGKNENRGRSATVYLPPVSGQRIRLGGENRTFTSGNIEVFVRNKWGIVCDDAWEIDDADVACRQLGFSGGAEKVTVSAEFGEGSWNGTDILMDDVGCNGLEQNILTCNYEYPSNCITLEAAGVVCQSNTGCPEGWIAGSESCYFLSKIPTTQKKFAVSKCANIGGHLVNIETETENHFLSSLFVNTPEPIVIGGIKKGKTWMWEKVERSLSDNYRRKRSSRRHGSRPKGDSRAPRHSGRTSSSSSYESIVQVSIDYFKWFPGWLPGNKKAEPSGKKSEKCLFLKNSFDHPDKSVGEVNVGYLYWSDDVCLRKKRRMRNGFRYLCERPKEETEVEGRLPVSSAEECYRDTGTEYRGTQANTEKGTECIKWSDSKKHTPEKFPDKGLEGHNYCRNPDGDVRPWCYVNNEGTFGFCPVPRCQDQDVEQVPMTTRAPVVTTTSAPECPDNKFYCAQSVKCISEQWHCDHEHDCDYAEDEADCDYKISQFDMTANRGILSNHVKETFMGSSNETCAKLCLSRISYVCRSFAFEPEDRSCQLSDVNTETTVVPFIWKYKSFVYELVSQRECEGMFTCDNGRCIDHTLVCNQHDDCNDLSDELLDTEECRSKDNVEVRLVGEEEQAGRVEVKYLGEWGVICDDNWDNKDATVICNMLGYKGATAMATGHSKYGSGNGNFLLDEVDCTGIEDSISECKHNGWKVNDCRSFEVAGVVCQAQKACASSQYSCGNGLCIEASQVCDGTCHCNPQCEDENGDGESDCRSAALEIVNGPVTGSGRVELVRNGLRGTICDDSWDNNDAAVVCRMVGYRYGEAVSGGTYGEGTGAIWLDDVECIGTEMSLSNCRMSNWGVTDCSHSEDAGVICSNTPPQTETPQIPGGSVKIYLEDGLVEGEGRVEVDNNGERGTVCDDSWDDNDATVVCKMLGYSFGIARVEAYYGPGSDRLKVMLDDVECLGTETSLLACRHAGWGTSNCAHGEDAGVKCYSGEDDNGEVDTGSSDVLSGVTCGLRPLESQSRKKREEPGGPGERELDSPPKFERIIGGFTAAKGFYPWQVGVRRLVSMGIYGHWCGGTILSEHWILSAAHCFSDLSKGHIVVRTGDHDNKVEDDFEQEFELEYLINHRLYDESTYDYDIALLKIKQKDGAGIKFNDHVQPACLPEQTTEYVDGQKCHVSGWGKTESGYQNLLKSARVPIIGDDTCQILYKDITDKMVCAGYLAGGIDSCAGDSGGPLVCDINGRYTVMGATSWGAGCAEANAPGVYTRVTEFIPWIKSTIKLYS